MKVRLTAVLIAMVALALPAVASAGLPKLDKTLITPAKSVGGVKIGGTAKSVTKAWGQAKEKCEFQCVYEGPKGKDDVGAVASVGLEAKTEGATPKVWIIVLAVGEKEVGGDLKPDFKTPLTKFKTAKGIGLGSTSSELTKAYPHMSKNSGPGYATYTLKGPRESATVFVTGAAKKVTSLSVQLHPGG